MPNDNVPVKIGDRIYDFSKDMCIKHPKLLDPSIRYMIGFDSVLPIIYGYPVSCIREDMIDENSEKQLFLKNCERLEIKLSDELILHLSSKLKSEIEECTEYVAKKAGRKGKGENAKMRFVNLKEVQEFCAESDGLFDDHGSDIRPLDVIRLLEVGTKKAIDQLVLKDFKSNNIIRPFITKFMSFFLAE